MVVVGLNKINKAKIIELLDSAEYYDAIGLYVFGYQYANTPSISGQFQRQAITQAADRFIFVGFFWTISDNKKTNNLDNL